MAELREHAPGFGEWPEIALLEDRYRMSQTQLYATLTTHELLASLAALAMEPTSHLNLERVTEIIAATAGCRHGLVLVDRVRRQSLDRRG